MRNRFYDPETGRFTQEDPIGIAGGLNLYRFAGGDPVNFSDPFGLCPDCILDVVAIALDIVDIARNGLSWGNAASLGVDAVAAALPVVPAVAGFGARTAGRGFRSFRAFKRAVGAAGEGRQWHHIVEQYQVATFGAARIHNTENLVSLPSGVHRRISAYYSTKQDFTGNKTVRQWLHDQSFEKQAEFGRAILERFLKDGNP